MIPGQKCSPEAELVATKLGNPKLLTMYKNNEINKSLFNDKTYQQMWCVYSIQFMWSEIYIITVNSPNLIPN